HGGHSALPGYDFTTKLPGGALPAHEVRFQVETEAEECNPEDTFLCYFAGHGFVYYGALYLIWDSTKLTNVLSTSIPVGDILRAISACKARSKLLILDCCSAGTAIDLPGFRDAAQAPAMRDVLPATENQQILMASGHLEKTRETDELQGGFLTANIRAALGTEFGDVDTDHDQRITVNDLLPWLEARTDAYNA